MIEPAHRFSDDALRDAFNDAFSDYLIGPPQLGAAEWQAFVRRQGADLAASRVEASNGQVDAFALIGRAGPGRCRVGAMGARVGARGGGAAPRLLDHVVAEAAARGDDSIELEVFAQNERAVRLYRSRGFEIVAPLHGYEAAAPFAGADAMPDAVSANADEGVHPVAPEVAAQWLDRCGLDLPYQVSGAAVRAATAPLLAWQRGQAQVVIARPAPQRVTIVSLVDTGSRWQQDARALLRCVRQREPQATIHLPQLQRPDCGGDALRAEGFTALPLHQWLMRRPLRAASIDS